LPETPRARDGCLSQTLLISRIITLHFLHLIIELVRKCHADDLLRARRGAAPTAFLRTTAGQKLPFVFTQKFFLPADASQ